MLATYPDFATPKRTLIFGKLGLIIFFLVFLQFYLSPQSKKIKFEHISITEGLSQVTVNSILQYKKGFMWFATEDGLNRYDGYNFQIFNVVPDAPNALSNNYLWTIYEDRSGIIWIGTWGGGLNSYNCKTGQFSRYMNYPESKNSLSHNEVRAICEDRSGRLWVGTRGGGLDYLDREAGHFYHFKHEPRNPNSLSHNEVMAIIEDRNGLLWIGTWGGGIDRMDPETKQFTNYQHIPGNPHSLGNNQVNCLFEDKNGVLWIGTNGGGLNKFDAEKGSFTRYLHKTKDSGSISDDNVRALFEDKAGSLWIGTVGGGLNLFDRESETFTSYRHNPTDPDSLTTNEVRAIFEDKSGVLWVSTYAGGLNKRNRKKEKFNLYKSDPGNPNSLSGQIVWSIAEDHNGIFWFGTNNGLNSFNRETDKFTHYKHDPSDPTSISNNNVRKVYEDSEGTLWIGTDGSGLNKFNHTTGKFTRYQNNPDDPYTLSHNVIRPIYEDHSKTLWIGTVGGGLNKFDRKTGRFYHYHNEPENPDSLSHDYVYSLLEDSRGDFWVGTWGGGLNKFDREKEIFTRYTTDPDNPQKLSNDLVLSIYEDSRGELWLGTSGGGLNKFNREDETFTHYRERDGLPNDVIYGILEDGQGNLWLSTNKGLSKFDPRKKEFRNFNVVDGLQSNEFNGGAYCKSKKGELFFGGINGFNVFYPQEILAEDLYIPPVVITKFLKFNQEVALSPPISEAEEILLSYQDNIFSFEFSALDYTAPERNRYAYKMENFKEEYIETDSNKRFASYTGLPPGNYTFKVKGTNHDGKWNEETASIRITIVSPFWFTWWFRIIIILAIFFALVLFALLRIKKVRLELKKEQLENELKLKADFTAMLVHDLRSPLTSIMGYAEMMTYSPEIIDLERTGNIITNSCEKMLQLINDMLVISQFEAGKISLNRTATTLESIVRETVEGMRPLLDMKKFTVEYEFANLPSLLIDREKIGQVITNFLSNAIKFSPDQGTIRVALKEIREEGKITQELAVLDHGIGVAEDKQNLLFEKYSQLHKDSKIKGTGLGLAVSRWIIESHQGEIGYRSREGGGSIFYFRLLQS